MKKKLCLALLAVATVSLTTQAQTTNLTLEWDYDYEVVLLPTGGVSTNTPEVFILRSAPSPATTPLTSWPVVATIPALQTNSGVVTYVKTYRLLNVPAGSRFYVLTASNQWGESDFSNVAVRFGKPTPGLNLKAKPAQ